MSSTKVTIGGVPYNVQFLDNLNGNDPNQIGNFDSELTSIMIKKMKNIDLMEKTFWHEAIHAVLLEYGFEVPEEEIICCCFASALMELIPQFYLMRETFEKECLK